MDYTRIRRYLANIWEAISAKLPNHPRLLETPSEEKVESAVKDYLDKNPGWIEYAIKHDKALLDKSEEEAIQELLTYQGLHAIALHVEAHALYEKGDLLEARRLSQGARRVTGGIEIHPGARIGKNFFVDHGSGVVIGETAEVGDNVFLYHTVTLGATGQTVKENGRDRRHPKLGNNITIGNGAQLLGPLTIDDDVEISTGARIIGEVHIGKGAKIMAGVEVREDVPAGAVVVGKLPELPGFISKQDAKAAIIRPKAEEEPGSTKWRDILTNATQKMAQENARGASRA